VKRRDKHNYYLDIAQTVLERGTCLRRNYGAIIVYRGSAPQKKLH
jgi:dCMP deaminase